jgi:ribonuclease Z
MYKKCLLLFAFLFVLLFTAGCSSSAESKKEGVSPDKAESSTEVESTKETSDANKEKNTPDGFRVTTIGTGSPPIEGGKTWPATLVQYQDKNFIVDCGGGCTHGLAKTGIHPREVSNLLFTHHHVDHNSDFITALIAGWATSNPRTELNLIGTEGTKKFYDFVIDFYKDDIEYRIKTGYTQADGMTENVNVQDLSGGEEFEIDGVKISTTPVPHSIETIAYKFEAGGQTVVLSGDLKYDEAFIDFTKDADLLVMDGMLAEVMEGDPFYEEFQKIKPQLASAHITLEEIGKIAAEANVKQVVLNHLMNGEIDADLTSEIIKEQGYEGNVIISESLGEYEVKP